MYLPGCPCQGLTSTQWHQSRHISYHRHAAIITRSSSQQQQPQHPQPEKPVLEPAPKQQQAFGDPRLKWARPEWVKPPAPPERPNPPPSPAAAAGLRPGSSIQSSAAALQRRQRLLNKVTYGSFNSSGGSSDDAADSSSSQQQHQRFFQAMGIDFGAHRVGIAVRRSSHNVPLLTLHRQQDTGSSDSNSSSSQPHHQQQQEQTQLQHQGGLSRSQRSSRSTARSNTVLPLQQTAAAVLHLALQEGCDGFVIGLPLYTDFSEPAAAAAAAAVKRRGVRQPGAAAGTAATAGAAAPGDGRWINSVIRGFAQTLADLAAPLELPVLLVNEEKSSQQARAVMAGAAAYDIRSQVELDAEQAAVSAGQQRQQRQQMSKRQRHELQKQQHAIGRDAFAAALILSRYYNGLVEPVEQLQGSTSSSSSSSSGDDDSSSSSSSSSSQQGGWASKKVQQQAAADLKWMLLSPKEQRRRREQHEQMKATAAAAAAAEAAAAGSAPKHDQPFVVYALRDD